MLFKVLLSANTNTGVNGILEDTGDLITSILGFLSSFTSWILSDPLAIMFFAIMMLMLGIHVLHSLVHKFS